MKRLAAKAVDDAGGVDDKDINGLIAQPLLQQRNTGQRLALPLRLYVRKLNKQINVAAALRIIDAGAKEFDVRCFAKHLVCDFNNDLALFGG